MNTQEREKLLAEVVAAFRFAFQKMDRETRARDKARLTPKLPSDAVQFAAEETDRAFYLLADSILTAVEQGPEKLQ